MSAQDTGFNPSADPSVQPNPTDVGVNNTPETVVSRKEFDALSASLNDGLGRMNSISGKLGSMEGSIKQLVTSVNSVSPSESQEPAAGVENPVLTRQVAELRQAQDALLQQSQNQKNVQKIQATRSAFEANGLNPDLAEPYSALWSEKLTVDDSMNVYFNESEGVQTPIANYVSAFAATDMAESLRATKKVPTLNGISRDGQTPLNTRILHPTRDAEEIAGVSSEDLRAGKVRIQF